MNLFNTIALEIGAVCNRKCWFCPNAYNKRPDEFMSDELILKIARELGSIKYDKRVIFYIYNEPFRDPRLKEIIKLFRKEVPRSTLMIATNGDYVKSSDAFQELFDIGLNQLQVNVYSNVKRYRKLKAMLEETNAIEGNIYSNTSAKVKYYSVEMKFDRALTPTSPKVGRFELSNRSGNVPKLPTVATIQKLCVRPFRVMQVNWKGQVILCCNDYHADVVCGDVNKTTVEEVWKDSPVFKSFRTKLLECDRTNLKLCDVCSFKGGEYQHFVKKFWPELL